MERDTAGSEWQGSEHGMESSQQTTIHGVTFFAGGSVYDIAGLHL